MGLLLEFGGHAIGSGGGLSLYESEPSYQQGVQSTGSRTTPDVSMNADPATGAWIADSYNLDPSNPFEVVGGTSLSAPAFAGLVALVNQGRVAAGEAVLNSSSPTETQQALYSLPQADYNSITSGSNGYTANAGYNLVTGLGTPVADLMVPDLIDYQGPGTSYAGPTVGPLLDATLDGTWAGGGGGVTNAFNVFGALTVGSNGFGHAQAPAAGIATGMPIGGSPATVVAGPRGATTTPMSRRRIHVRAGDRPRLAGCAAERLAGGRLPARPASCLSRRSGATIAPASNGHAASTVAWSAAQPEVSTPITYAQPSGFLDDRSGKAGRPHSRRGPGWAWWPIRSWTSWPPTRPSGNVSSWDGTTTIPVLPSDRSRALRSRPIPRCGRIRPGRPRRSRSDWRSSGWPPASGVVQGSGMPGSGGPLARRSKGSRSSRGRARLSRLSDSPTD